MRDYLKRNLISWMKEDANILFLAADIGGGLYKDLYTEFGDRVLNVGIAEQNLVGMAAGLSNLGYRVICYSKACFISLRVIDQIKNQICYPDVNAVFVAADAGYDESNAGHPHIALEDIGVMQMMPNMRIYLPTVYEAMDTIIDEIRDANHPAFIRMNKDGISFDKFRKIDEFTYYVKEAYTKDTVFISYGSSVQYLTDRLRERADVSIVAFNKLSLSSEFIDELRRYDRIAVFEEQFEAGGLYAYLCRKLIGVDKIKIDYVGPANSYMCECYNRDEIIKKWQI